MDFFLDPRQTWKDMMRRCYDPRSRKYAEYGGRGILVDLDWHDYRVFFNDMGLRPLGYSLDRIDNDGPYTWANCRWALPREQQNNKRSNHCIEWRGETFTLAQWSDRFSLSPKTLRKRLRNGWSVERALTTPVNEAMRRHRHV